ncbi:hypothetical protein AAHH78_35595, partial [Burkholderia pseudomallei]
WTGTDAQLPAQTHWHVRSIRALGKALVVEIDDVDAIYPQDPLERIATIRNRDAPLNVRAFPGVAVVAGVPGAALRGQRTVWGGRR